MTSDLKGLSPPERKVAAKELILNGYSSRKVEEILGIDHATALRYAVEEVPEEMRQFATIFKNRIREQKEKGIDLVHKRLLDLIPKERRIDPVVRAGEYLEGKNTNTNVNIENKVLVMPSELINKYAISQNTERSSEG